MHQKPNGKLKISEKVDESFLDYKANSYAQRQFINRGFKAKPKTDQQIKIDSQIARLKRQTKRKISLN